MKSKISIVLFLILSISSFAQYPDLKILSSDLNGITIEYSPVLDTNHIFINGDKFIKFNLNEGIAEKIIPGAPFIMSRNILIGVPDEFGNVLEILQSSSIEIPGKLVPFETETFQNGQLKTKLEINENYNSSQKDFKLIKFGKFSTIRDLAVQSILISPVNFNSQSEKIRFYTKVIFRVRYSANKISSQKNIEDGILKDLISNYQTAKNWIKRENRISKVNNSVLATGSWFSFYVENENDPAYPQEGIYKIDKQTLLNNGIDANSIDPRTIKIYNNGGKVLPENVNVPVPNDLVENAIMIVGEEDGRFDDADYILFYGRSNHFWEFDSSTNQVKRFLHPYSKFNYYFLTFGNENGKRISTKSSIQGDPANVNTITKAYVSWEKDETKVMESGRLYMGDILTERSKTKSYVTPLPGLIQGSEINYVVDFANRAVGSVPLIVEENGNTIISQNLFGVGDLDDPYRYRANPINIKAKYSGNIIDNRSVLKFTYNATASPSLGFINYFEIIYDRDLFAQNDELIFYSNKSHGNTEYRLDGFMMNPVQLKVFDISNFANVKIIGDVQISESKGNFRINEDSLKISKYIAVTPTGYKTPKGFSKVENSILRGISSGAKFIIITHKDFIPEAERLKAHKESSAQNRVSTVVIDVQHIFNEFSNGIQDVSAIRNFLKTAYENWTEKPEYVLLFGDGNYDYKNVEGKEPNFVIPYESYESYRYLGSYVSDDFYADIISDTNIIDLATGRINVTNPQEAKSVVDKIIDYETAEIGGWRNSITLVADDLFVSGGTPEPNLHTPQSESLSRKLPGNINQTKIYAAMYPTVFLGTGRRKPAANQAIINAINEGTLIINYYGHGNPEVWAHEFIFEKGVTIPQLNNRDLCFLTAATCDFGRYDVPGNQSATELMMIKENSGIIAGFTAARTVYSSDNAALNEMLYANLFKKDESGLVIPIGKAYLNAKISRLFGGQDSNDKKFHLYGDPTLRLNVPRFSVKIDSVNNQNLATEVQIKALSDVSINGTVLGLDSLPDMNYSGEGIVTLFDADRDIRVTDLNNYPVKFPGQPIYRGKIDISNGNFSTNFIVPKDISFENKRGKIVVYINNENNDGVGFTGNVLIGGIDTTKTNDGKGPEIEILFDDQTSSSNFMVDRNPNLKVKLKDETGINAGGAGIGHKLSGILNDDENNFIDFTNHFLGDANSGGKSGEINYRFQNLENGEYQIKIKAFDVFNNASEATGYFSVSDNSNLAIENVYNFPNPFSGSTKFTFSRNQSGVPVDIKIRIYSVAGRLIKNIDNFNVSDSFVQIDWDGRDEDGNLASNGVYLYKVTVKTIDGSFKKEVLSKLAIIR